MKICILSMQRVPNFGSVLQSYSLKKILNSMGHEVKFLDIEYREEDDSLMRGHRLDYSSECAKGGIIAKIKKIDRYAINRIKIKKKSNQQDLVFDQFLKEDLVVADKKEKFDWCIIGSDEVFNCANDAEWGFTTQLFGNVKQAKNVATYAASSGATTIDILSESVRDRIKKAFKNVSYFSVRDDNTEKFVKALTNKKVEKHLDPVIIGNFDNEIKEHEGVIEKLPKQYCIVYSYYNRINNPEEISLIKKFCKKHSMEIISIGAPQMWISKHMVLTPFETLVAFKHAEFVVTDTFHGTIFSAKYAKKFIAISRPSNVNKMSALVRSLKIEKNYAKDFREIENIYIVEKNVGQINDIVNQEKTRSLAYLQRILSTDK